MRSALRTARILSALLSLAVLAAAQAPAKPGERLRLRFAPGTAPRAPGQAAVPLELCFFARAESVRLDLAGVGGVRPAREVRELDGPFAVGTSATRLLEMELAGDGELAVRAVGLGASGEPLFERTMRLWCATTAAGLRLSGASSDTARRSAVEPAHLAVVPSAPPTPREQELADHLGGLLASAGAATAAPVVPFPESGRVTGVLRWTDAGGGTHPLPRARVELRAAGSDALLVAGETGPDGRYDLYPPLTTATEARLVARTVSPVARVLVPGAGPYAAEPASELSLLPGQTVELSATVTDGGEGGAAFEVHTALVHGGAYASALSGALPAALDVRFPTDAGTSYLDPDGPTLHLLHADRRDWDVALHEYAHHVAHASGFASHPGGAHDFGVHLSSALGKPDAVRLAFAEGWASWFALAAQARTGAAALGLPGVGDRVYDDTEDAALAVDAETSRGLGEDDELSVLAALWDLTDLAQDGADAVTVDDRVLFAGLADAGADTLGRAWAALQEDAAPRSRAALGAVLAEQSVAPLPVAPTDGAAKSGPPPTFEWMPGGAGAVFPLDDFRLRFYAADFETPLGGEIQLGPSKSYTPSPSFWATLQGSPGPVHWVVEGLSLSSPSTPGVSGVRYSSGPRSLGGAGAAVVADETEAGEGGRAALAAGLERWAAEASLSAPGGDAVALIAYGAGVREVLVDEDAAAVAAALASLPSVPAADCEARLLEAVALAGSRVRAGGALVVATARAPAAGADLGDLLERLRARGVRVHVLHAGECAGAEAAVWEDFGSTAARLTALGPQKPGDGAEPPSPDGAADLGPGFDDHGDTLEGATPLVEGASPVVASVGSLSDPLDVFALELEGGVPYALDVRTLAGLDPEVRWVGTDGGAALASLVSSYGPSRLALMPERGGTHGVTVQGGPGTLQISYERDPTVLLAGGLATGTALAVLTGGAIAVEPDLSPDGAGAADPAGDAAAAAFVHNALASAVEPRVVRCVPATIPRGAVTALTLQGAGTSWRPDTEVEVLAGAVTVEAVQVLGPTELVVRLSAAVDAELGSAELRTRTPLGAALAVERGAALVEVVPGHESPTLLSAQPFHVRPGEERLVALFVQGAGLAPGAPLEFLRADGAPSALTPLEVEVLSPSRVNALVRVDDDAPIGLETARLGAGADALELPDALLVGPGELEVPRIVSATPGAAVRGARVELLLEVTGAVLEPERSEPLLGPDLEVLGFEVLESTRARLDVRVRPSASIGAHALAVETDGRVAASVGGFLVADVPEVPALGPGPRKWGGAVPPHGARAASFEARAGDELVRVYATPWADGSPGTVAPPDLEVQVLGPGGAVLASHRGMGGAVDFGPLTLPADGTYRLVALEHAGVGGAFKAIALVPGGAP